MSSHKLLPLIKIALAEDVGSGDITSSLLIPADVKANLAFTARQPLVVCGGEVPALVYGELDTHIKTEVNVPEGEKVGAGTVLVTVSGPARALLVGERVALNLMQRMSGVATLTRNYVDAVAGTKAVILDTRKTIPGMRYADKYAVRVGGGNNHRMRLDDMILIKDNHIALAGSIADAVAVCRNQSVLPIVVECDTMTQVIEALKAKPDRILLDNMNLAALREVVDSVNGKIPLEASGGIHLETVRSVAETGVDFISVGAITHSATSVDIGLDITVQ